MISISELTKENSPYIGKEIWIAEANFKMERPRIIKPTSVLVVDVDNLPKNKRIYYSCTYLTPVGKNSKIIPIYDNTGYRSFTGNPLSAFDTKEEATVWFNSKMQEKIEERVTNREAYIKEYDEITEKYKNLLTD